MLPGAQMQQGSCQLNIRVGCRVGITSMMELLSHEASHHRTQLSHHGTCTESRVKAASPKGNHTSVASSACTTKPRTRAPRDSRGRIFTPRHSHSVHLTNTTSQLPSTPQEAPTTPLTVLTPALCLPFCCPPCCLPICFQPDRLLPPASKCHTGQQPDPLPCLYRWS